MTNERYIPGPWQTEDNAIYVLMTHKALIYAHIIHTVILAHYIAGLVVISYRNEAGCYLINWPKRYLN